MHFCIIRQARLWSSSDRNTRGELCSIQNNGDLNQDIFHPWSKFDDPSLNRRSRGQAQNGVSFEFEVKFDLEGQDQSRPPNIYIYI